MSERIEAEVLADVVEPLDMVLSPDGKKVVYATRAIFIRASENMKCQLWIAEVGKEYSARALTTDEYNNYSPKFSPDGRYVSFVSDRAKPGQAGHLYLLPLDGGEAQMLTPKDNEMGVGNYRWRSDGKVIAFTSANEKSEERKQREKDKKDAKVYGEDVDYAKLRTIDVQTKEVTALPTADGNVASIAWNPDCTKIAYAVSKDPSFNELQKGGILYVLNIESGSSTKLLHFKSMIIDLQWDQDRLVWNGVVNPVNTVGSRGVVSVPCDKPSDSHEILSHGKIDCVDNIKSSNGKIFVLVKHGLTDTIELLDGTEILSEKALTRSWDAHIQDSRTTLVVGRGRTGIPTQVFSIVDGNKVQLSQLSKDLTGKDIGHSHLFEYTHEDGTPIDGYYCIPSSMSSSFKDHKPQPTIVLIHGGPYDRITDSFDMFWHWPTFFMQLGFLVLVPNYRGGVGHGDDYAKAVYHNAASSYEDVIWLVKKGIEDKHIDPDYVAVSGWSQGGFLTYLSMTRDSTFHFRAGIAGAGVTEWTTMVLTSDLPEFEGGISGTYPWHMDNFTDVQARKSSALYFMRDIKTPLLILHGERDERTPFEQAVGFYRGMKALGKDVTLVAYPGEGHCSPVPWTKAHYIDMQGRIETFLKKHMSRA